MFPLLLLTKKIMWKLKEKYKDATLSRNRNSFKLSDVRQDQVESLGLQRYFTKEEKSSKVKKDK